MIGTTYEPYADSGSQQNDGNERKLGRSNSVREVDSPLKSEKAKRGSLNIDLRVCLLHIFDPNFLRIFLERRKIGTGRT